MENREFATIASGFRTLFGAGTAGSLTDSQLLERFVRRSDETAMARWCCGFALTSSTIRMPPRMPSRLRFSSWRERLERSGTGNPSRVGSSVSPVGCPVGPWRSDPDGSRGRDTDSLCRRAAPGSVIASASCYRRCMMRSLVCRRNTGCRSSFAASKA